MYVYGWFIYAKPTVSDSVKWKQTEVNWYILNFLACVGSVADWGVSYRSDVNLSGFRSQLEAFPVSSISYYTMKSYICEWLYIYIYIIRVLVVSKSLCGYVSDQVQYNMERAQYLGLSYYIIMIIDKYIVDICIIYIYIYIRHLGIIVSWSRRPRLNHISSHTKDSKMVLTLA